MTISFVSNFINHHQVAIADEFYKVSNCEFTFICTMPMPESFKKSGYPNYNDRPYVLQAWESEDCNKKALEIITKTDVAIFDGFEALDFEIYRIKHCDKITFDVSEHWFKRGLINILSPRFLKFIKNYYLYLRNEKVYKLCASSHVASEMNIFGAFKGKCYKWGYFPEIPSLDIERIIADKFGEKINFMWCSRFIHWKKPELVIELASKLRDKGIKFSIDMYGGGPMFDTIQNSIKEMNLENHIFLRGNVPNSKIIEEMRKHDFFLLTSDQNEGWGAVANEAMGSGCVLIGSDKAGAIPYLIKDGITGITFKSSDADDLFNSTIKILNDKLKCQEIAINAYNYMRECWNAETAVRNLTTMVSQLKKGKTQSPFAEGPCSNA